MTSKSILKIKRDNRSEIQNKYSDGGDGTYSSLVKWASDASPLVSSAQLHNPNVHELIRIKCNDFLTTNLQNLGSASKKLGRKTLLDSKDTSKENLANDLEIDLDVGRLKIHAGIPVKNYSATDQVKSLETKEVGKKTPKIKIKLDRKSFVKTRLNSQLPFQNELQSNLIKDSITIRAIASSSQPATPLKQYTMGPQSRKIPASSSSTNLSSNSEK